MLVEDLSCPRSEGKGVIDFVHYLNYRSSVTGDYLLKSKKLKELKFQFFSQYQIIEAAGGVVFNEEGEVLLIYRRGSWDLPKGKIEKKEKRKEAAVREVEEETGITGVVIEEPVSLYYNGKKTTYHTYRYKRKQALKPSYWYIMSAKKQKLTPQTSEDIEKAKWVAPQDFEKYYQNMYPAIQDVLKSVCDWKPSTSANTSC